MDSFRPLVSIVIPCYKAEKELPTALASISQQTYSHWEIIAVNDGWPDNTDNILADFAKLHPNHKVRYLNHDKNQGLGATRNTAIAAATGTFIAFLDHDDLWESNHLFHGLDLIRKNKADIYYSSVLVFNADGTGNDWIWGPTPEDLKEFPQSIFGRNFIQPSSVIISKNFINKLGLMDTHPSVHFCEDHDYWIRSVNLEGKFVTSNEVTVRYRYANPDAATAKIPLMMEHDISVQKKHLEPNQFTESIKYRAISDNYRRLANYFWESNHLKSLIYLGLSVYWNPQNWGNLQQLVKGILYWPHIFRTLKRT